jgi:Protein of unknown function (DUF1232)
MPQQSHHHRDTPRLSSTDDLSRVTLAKLVRARSPAHRTMSRMSMSPPLPPASPPPPMKPRSVATTLLMIAIAGISALYLVNPTFGIFELLPDNLPLFGNLDEAFFTLALVSALAWLGIKLPFLPKR